ncbi:MAG: hypothetical protein O3C43_16575 [Verrucomicrobia bacterium]|nr:hypothetical protein [Verrucomicrobiota bacterium]MDA1068106.1 hypothetical protein [Verrucomicrobiota bacterium]
MKIPKSALSILVAWIVVFILSFVLPRFTVTGGDGFTRGLDRVGAFFMWQLAAVFLSVILALVAWSRMRSRPGLKWLFSVPLMLHMVLVIFVIGVFVMANFRKPPASYYEPPVTATPTATGPIAEAVPATTPVAPSSEQPTIGQNVQTYMGIYKSGFEMNHFYTMEGQGPWWLESTDELHEKLQSFYVERPGRGGGVTVAMTVSAYTSDIGSGFNHLAPIEKRSTS